MDDSGFRVWDVKSLGWMVQGLGFEMSRVWDVWSWGCLEFGMSEVWDVWSLGCLGSGMPRGAAGSRGSATGR